MITHRFLFVNMLNENKREKIKLMKGEGKMPNFELTAEDACRFFNMLPDSELEKFLEIMEAEMEAEEETEQNNNNNNNTNKI